MSWKPSIKQLEVIAEMATARLPSHKIAKMLGVDFEVFLAWGLRAASAVEQEPERQPVVISKTPEPKASRIVAERMFEPSRNEIV